MTAAGPLTTASMAAALPAATANMDATPGMAATLAAADMNSATAPHSAAHMSAAPGSHPAARPTDSGAAARAGALRYRHGGKEGDTRRQAQKGQRLHGINPVRL
jgi:hypothetical protein